MQRFEPPTNPVAVQLQFSCSRKKAGNRVCDHLLSSALFSRFCLSLSSRFSLRSSLLTPRGRPFSPPSRPSGTEPLLSLLYPFSALCSLPSSEPILFSAGGLFCDLFSALSSRFSLRSSLSAFRPLLSLLLFSHLACCWSDVAALRVPQFLIHNGYG